MKYFLIQSFICIIITAALKDISAEDNLEKFFQLTPTECFEVLQNPKCQTTIPDHFKAQNPVFGGDKPTTAIFLFTLKNPDKAELLHRCGGKLPPDSSFDCEANTEIFIHGWLDGVCRSAWMREMKEQLFQRALRTGEKFNVILVDWSWGNLPDYFRAGVNCQVVGEQVGFVINNIMKQTGCGPEKFHVIGHSFGAIASGYIGRSVPNLRRITGLDPALAPYKYSPPEQRLTYRDARIVDIIHTNAADCFAIAVGDDRQLGHADFYPNGGLFQASCYPYLLISFLKLDIFYGFVDLIPHLCSHTQSLQYYKASINNDGCQFVGVTSISYKEFQKRNSSTKLCRNQWAVMGMDYEKYPPCKNGLSYFLDTSLLCPYYDNSRLGSYKFPFNTTCSA